MSDHTGIEWTDATWNPIRGCTRVSDGCRHCYAERVAARFSGPDLPYEGIATMRDGEPRWTGHVRLIEDHLGDPLRWTKPRRIFVNSMSDLFHEKLAEVAIDRIFAVMARAQQHTFQILTKRPARMLEYFGSGTGQRVWDRAGHPMLTPWPLPNVWLGVSAENQATADERIPLLVDTPAAMRFVSAEPLLGRIELDDGWEELDWIIVGGESGPGARPMHPRWARSLRDQLILPSHKTFSNKKTPITLSPAYTDASGAVVPDPDAIVTVTSSDPSVGVEQDANGQWWITTPGDSGAATITISAQSPNADYESAALDFSYGPPIAGQLNVSIGSDVSDS